MVWGSIILGLIFVVAGIVYFITPANSLPSMMPGFDVSITKIHYKHGIGSIVLGLGLFAFAWFQSSPNKGSTEV